MSLGKVCACPVVWAPCVKTEMLHDVIACIDYTGSLDKEDFETVEMRQIIFFVSWCGPDN